MKTKTVAYWITTGLVALAMGAGGVMDISGPKEVVEGMQHLGYPAYFATIIGVWKVLAAPALLAPGLPRLKEWAYAGIAFDLTGAAASHAFSGDPLGNVVTPLFILAIAAASWALRPDARRLAAPTLVGAKDSIPAGQPVAA